MTVRRDHLWYPYAQHARMRTPLQVQKAQGVYLTVEGQAGVIDGLSSWWCMIHGYNHPLLNEAITTQLHMFAHVMLGGLTHEPAQQLAQTLVEMTPAPLQHVFFADSGSVGCEVAIKMALQYWINQHEPQKKRLIALNRGYHGDTFGVMALGNPEDDCPSMHRLFRGHMPHHVFLPSPRMGFDATPASCEAELAHAEAVLRAHHQECAAFICEPLMQGAGGFNFYSPYFLNELVVLCKRYNVLVIFDEVATGFGRTGTFFALDRIATSPDIVVFGKALTAGYSGHSATLATTAIFDAFKGDTMATALMHGPTFMGNPIACAVAQRSIDIMKTADYLAKIAGIEAQLKAAFMAFHHPKVKECRVLGATLAVEVYHPADLEGLQAYALKKGVWLRPILGVVYLTPPYIITADELDQCCGVINSWFERQ